MPGVRSAVVGVLGVVTATATLSACTQSSVETTARLVVTPATSRADEPVALQVQGVPGGTEATVTVAATDSAGLAWTASAPFTVGAGGALTPSSTPGDSASNTAAPPVSRDPTALVAQMQPPKGSSDANGMFFGWGSTPVTFTWTLTVGGQQRATASTQRTFGQAGAYVVHPTQAADGVAGTYAAVQDGKRHPAVLALGGSEGGFQAGLALALAARGIPTLAQAYFKAPGLANRLSQIPLETFDRGLAWLQNQPDVDPAHIWVTGASRGSEAALLVASRRPDVVHGVLVTSPSNVVQQDFPASGTSAWSVGGQPVPYTAQDNNPAPTDTPDAVIPVEKVAGPVLAVCGGQDTLWTSCPFAEAIMTRLDGAKSSQPHRLWTYPLAGHWVDILLPYQPLRLDDYHGGLSPDADAQARADVWPKIVATISGSGG